MSDQWFLQKINEKVTMIKRTDKPSIRTFKFINSISGLGRGVGSLKYLIVESKITLLIEALNPLIKYRKPISNPGVTKIFKNHHLFVFSVFEYKKVYLNTSNPIIIRNKFVIKNSMGDFTSPHAKVDEKFAGSTIGPDKNREGKSTRKINTLKPER